MARNDNSDPYREMGEGPVPAREFETEIRVHRHNIKALIAQTNGQVEFNRMAIDRAVEALTIAKVVDVKMGDLNRDIYGDPSKGEAGLKAMLSHKLDKLESSNKKLLLGLIGASMTVIGDLVVRLSTH